MVTWQPYRTELFSFYRDVWIILDCYWRTDFMAEPNKEAQNSPDIEGL